MKLLLTGSTGFVGRNLLLETLKSKKYEQIWLPVRSLEKLRTQFQGDGYNDIPSEVKPLVTSGPDWKLGPGASVDHVVHSAGMIVGRKRAEYFQNNVESTLSLLRQLQSPSKVVILSSMTAAGPCTEFEKIRQEQHPENPVTWYGESKLEMERKVASEFSHLNYICLRPPLIFGPRDQMTLPLFKMIRQPFHFKPGLRLKFFSYLSVFDLVRAIFLTLESTEDWRKLPYRNLFVCSREPVTDSEILTQTARVSGRKGFICKVPQPFLKVASRVIDSIPPWRASVPTLSADRAKEIWPDRWVTSPDIFSMKFNWTPEEDLPTTLRATYEWYVKTGQLT